jgi:tetratricopeptide (TPR) repeat protein
VSPRKEQPFSEEGGNGLDRLLRQAALPRPEFAELRRVRARVGPRIEARRRLMSRAAICSLPLVAAVAVALPAWRSYLNRTERLPAAVEAPATAVEQVVPVALPSAVIRPPEPIAAQPRRRRHVSTLAPIAAPRDGPTQERDTLADETNRLASAISLLRKRADAAGALQALDDYRRDYPQAHFASEARVVRIEALIASGRRDEALAELSPAELPSLPRGEELWVVRGEILLELGRPRDALEAFDTALRSAKADALVERALTGRAAAQRSIAR